MIYGMQLFNEEPRVRIDVDISEAQHRALSGAEAGTFETIEAVALGALRSAGLTTADRLHLSVFSQRITEPLHGYTAAQVEARVRGERDLFENPRSDEAKAVIPALRPILLRAQKQRYWREVVRVGMPIL